MSLITRHLLLRTAQLYTKQRAEFSREEIVKRINEIKYLSSQKKVPKLTIRKEITHLERKLEGIFDMEKKLLMQKKKESSKVTHLKKQITTLKKKLETGNDKDLQKKVDKLSHLLGEYLAKKGTEQEISEYKKIIASKPAAKKSKKVKKQVHASVEVSDSRTLAPELIHRIRLLEDRLHAVQHELEIAKRLEAKDPAKVGMLDQKIALISKHLRSYYTKYPELEAQEMADKMEEAKEQQQVVESPLKPIEGEVKHTLLFEPPTSPAEQSLQFPKEAQYDISHEPEVAPEREVSDAELEAELPLPPPPRMTG